jgi:hypothetical protein
MPTDVPNVLAGDDIVPFMASDGTTPVNNRRQIRRGLIGALLAPGSAELVVRDGVLPRMWGSGAEGLKYTSLSLLQGGSPGQFVVPYLGNAVISRSGEGPIIYTQRSSPNIPLDPADASNPRYDLVYLRYYDTALSDVLHGVKWGVVKGDAGATPSIPTAPAPAGGGVLAIGAVLRPANVNTVTNANITDLRKSAAVLGTTRHLLPGDLLTDAGAYHREMRSRTTPTSLTALGVPPVLYDWWDAVNSVWHGTQSFQFTARLTSPGTISNAATRIGSQIVIPDPGWAYRISGSAHIRLNVSGGPAANLATAQLRVGNSAPATTHDDTVVSAGVCQAFGSGGYFPVPMGTSDKVWTGSQTVYKLVTNNTGAVATLVGGTDPFDTFTVIVDPA